MTPKTLEALKWIVGVLDQAKIPYKIGGGLAAHFFGSPRPINDIDISLSGKYFAELIPLVKDYISADLQHYKNEKWDCDTLCLNYHGQDIDITDVDTLLMSDITKTKWIKVKEIRKYDPVIKETEGIKISLMDLRDLLAYKVHLDGEHQKVDVEAIKKLC